MAGVVDLRVESAKDQIAKYKLDSLAGDNMAAMLRKCQPDFVVDLTVPESHCKVTCAALAAGYHVIGEKPMASSMAEARKMVQAAKRNHPAHDFVQGDIFQANPFEPESFDVVFCSGAFNLNLGNNEQFLPRAVAALLELAREHAVFNLLHSRAASQERTYFYCHPDQVREMLRGCPCQVRIVDDYLHNDFTVICEKQQHPPQRSPRTQR